MADTSEFGSSQRITTSHFSVYQWSESVHRLILSKVKLIALAQSSCNQFWFCRWKLHTTLPALTISLNALWYIERGFDVNYRVQNDVLTRWLYFTYLLTMHITVVVHCNVHHCKYPLHNVWHRQDAIARWFDLWSVKMRVSPGGMSEMHLLPYMNAAVGIGHHIREVKCNWTEGLVLQPPVGAHFLQPHIECRFQRIMNWQRLGKELPEAQWKPLLFHDDRSHPGLTWAGRPGMFTVRRGGVSQHSHKKKIEEVEGVLGQLTCSWGGQLGSVTSVPKSNFAGDQGGHIFYVLVNQPKRCMHMHLWVYLPCNYQCNHTHNEMQR